MFYVFTLYRYYAIIGNMRTENQLHTANREIIDRDTYKKIKKMNREELTKFILQYEDEPPGEKGKTIDFPALEAELSKFKGIGGKRF